MRIHSNHSRSYAIFWIIYSHLQFKLQAHIMKQYKQIMEKISKNLLAQSANLPIWNRIWPLCSFALKQSWQYIPLGPRPPVLGKGSGSVVYSYILLKGWRSTHRLFFELGNLNGGCAWLSNFRAITVLVLNNLNSKEFFNQAIIYKIETTAILCYSCILLS